MKVKPTNSKLLKSYGAFISAVSTALSLLLIFVSIPDDDIVRTWLGIGFLVVLIIIYMIFLWRANKKDRVQLKIQGTKVEVKFGDIFEESGLKLIPFNEYFDTTVDDIIVSSNSLHGQYVQKHSGIAADELRKLFDNDPRLRNHVAFVDSQRPCNAQTAYKLGTVFKHNDYLLLAFTKFDAQNRAYLDNKLLWNCLINMWKNIDIVHSGQSICIPLLGTGIARLYEMNLNEQQLLELLLVSLRLSGVKFNWNVKVSIIVYYGNRDMIDLYGLSTYSD